MSAAQELPHATDATGADSLERHRAADVGERGRADDEEREQLLARAQLQATELEAIFSAHADGLIIYGPDGEIRSMNPAARELFGIDEDAAPASHRELMKALAPVDARGKPVDYDELTSRRAMRGELVKGLVMGVHTKRGRVWYSASGAPLWAADGSIAGAVVSCVDITHLRRLQEEREQVIRALTHDARTRLNVIRTHAELLGLADVTEDAARRRARIIASSACRLAELIDALVDQR